MKKYIGKINKKISTKLNLSELENKSVYIGESNIEHMKNSHPDDFRKYFNCLGEILNDPDYARINKKDSSIELVKKFLINNEYVKLAIRISLTGILYARSLYVLNPQRVERFIEKGTLQKIKEIEKKECL